MNQNCIYQDEIEAKIHNRIRGKTAEWYIVLLGANEKKLVDYWEMFRRFVSTLSYLESRFDMDEVYEVLENIFEELRFDKGEIDELMSLVKMLDRDHLIILLFDLEVEFSRPVNTLNVILKK